MRSDLRKLGSTLEQRTRTAVEFLEIARELDEVMKAAVALAPRCLGGTNEYDANTSYANAIAVTKRLGNAVLLTHARYGHIAPNDVSTCVEKARVAYPVDLQTPPPGTVCAPDDRPFS